MSNMSRKENKIIKLLEKIVEQNQQIINNLQYKGLGYPWTKPYNPPVENPFTWPTEPTYTNNVTCLHCGRDTGIPMMLNMVIPPEGLKCPHCGRTAVYSNSPTCQEPYSTTAVPCINTNVSTGDSNIKGHINREATPVTHRAYDGTISTLPVNPIINKWTAAEVDDFMKARRDNL